MKVEFFGNATAIITTPGGVRVLCDPWFTQGAFLGSWFTWPPVVQSFESVLMAEKVNCIYISHLHTDHFDRNFLARYLRRHPETPVVINRFAHPWLFRSVKSLNGGNAKIFEVGASSPFTTGDLTLKIYAADECNPLVCGSHIPCIRPKGVRSIDSVAIFEAAGLRILNANDAMGLDFAKRMWRLIGDVDLVMGYYAGASPYPQCFPDIGDGGEEKERIIHNACGSLGEIAERLKARYVFPFAGQYVLGGRLVALNEKRAVCTAQEATHRLVSQNISAIPFSLAIGEGFDLRKEDGGAPESPLAPAESTNYLQEIAGRRFPYENSDRRTMLGPLTPKSFQSMFISGTQRLLDIVSSTSPLTTSDVSYELRLEGSLNKGFINFSQNPSLSFEEPLFPHNLTSIEMPENLFCHLFVEKKNSKGFSNLNWNQADVGSHFVYRRAGKFDPDSNYLLSYVGS